MTTTALPYQAVLEMRPTATIRPSPTNPRRYFDPQALAELAASLKAKGVEQPLVIREVPGHGAELVHGERRLRAAKLAGLELVPVLVRQLSDEEVIGAQLAEMGHAQDIGPLEKATAYKRELARAKITQQELARRIGVSEGAVSETLGLLTLPDYARAVLERPPLTISHGRELLRLLPHPSELKRVVADVARRLREGAPPSSKRLRADVENTLRWKREEEEEEARKRKAAAAAKDQAKRPPAGKPAKLSPAELTGRKARARQAQLGRHRHLEVIARAPAIAKLALKEAPAYRLPPAALVPIAQALDIHTLPDGAFGDRNLTYDTLAHLGPAVIGQLPGRWRKVTSTEAVPRPSWALDARAARSWLGLWSWLAFRTRGLEAQLDKAAALRIVAAGKQKVAAARKGSDGKRH